MTSRCFLWLLSVAAATPGQAASFNVRSFGAEGDGHAIDSPAINRAIDAAAAAGGGLVEFPAGNYLAYSIHLRSHVALQLAPGCVIVGAETPAGPPSGYDAAEPNPSDRYEDFGHAHWHNSLIWGENLVDVGITGPGRIYGRGLSIGKPGPEVLPAGVGNKAIGLKNCRGVIFRDFTILHGGHFAILGTGVDNWICDGLTIDTDRDGIDIDSCRNVRVSNCTVNSPNDDAICPKSSLALGYPRAAEDITITNCRVSGFAEGSVLDGTQRRTVPLPRGPCGRIKCGTESNGGFRRLTISNCVLVYSRGIDLETADGGPLEDVTISNIAMDDIMEAPIFLRLGRRLRRPPGDATLGSLRRIKIDNVIAHHVNATDGIVIAGGPGNPVEDVSLSHLQMDFAGGGTVADAARTVPEDEPHFYPDPIGLGRLPAWGLFIRHACNISVDDVVLRTNAPDRRPIAHVEDAAGVTYRDSPGLSSAQPWNGPLLKEAATLGKPAWRGVLQHDAVLHGLGTHPPSEPFAFEWEEIGIGYNPAFGHWDVVQEILDVLPSAPEHARDQLLNDLHLQHPDGFIPGSVWMPGHPAAPDGKPNINSSNKAHPPVWVVAADDYLAQTGDDALLPEFYDRVTRQIGWFERNRRVQPEGYFYSDVLKEWESGVDQGVRYLDAPRERSACVDATAQVYQLYAYAAKWARALHKEARPWRARADAIAHFLQRSLWDESSGFFYDAWSIRNPALRHEAFEGMWPVAVGAATPAQARRVIDEWLLNPRRFFGAHPIATIGREDPRFELRMWRGPAWNSMTYWAARACMRYHRPDAAARLLGAALDDTAAQYDRTGRIWEFYDPAGGPPELLNRKPETPFKHPFSEYLGHNPLFAMARMWTQAAAARPSPNAASP